MATVTYIKYDRQNHAALNRVCDYVSQTAKTEQADGSRLVSGINCVGELAPQQFATTRAAFRKESPVWFYHYVQSFSPEEDITPEQAHRLAKDFAKQAWPGSEVLIATHTDAAHIHSHFIINAVCCETGKMLRQHPNTLKQLRELSDRLCQENSLSVLPPKENATQGMSGREYRAAVKGESWKMQLCGAISYAMERAADKEDFIAIMAQNGYGVRWEPDRKNITYITPKGKKCRDKTLHEMKYLKERMEYEFKLRTEIIHRCADAAQPVYAARFRRNRWGVWRWHPEQRQADQLQFHSEYEGVASHARRIQQPLEFPVQHRGFDEPDKGGSEWIAEHTSYQGASVPDGYTVETACGEQQCHADTFERDERATDTGWETERAAFMAHLVSGKIPAPEDYSGHRFALSNGVLAIGLVLGSISGLSDDNAAYRPRIRLTIDRKRLRELRRKKLSQGNYSNEPEPVSGWGMSL